jgi:membrane protein YqaA with SNARE-associated domain
MAAMRAVWSRYWPVALAFGWAVGEATVLPIMPDAVLVPLALARPASWWRLSLAAMLGSSVGGAVSYWRGGRSPTTTETVAGLPLVRPAMVAAAERWLASMGPRGILRQPLSGVPFKVFARLAGARHLPLGAFLAWAVLGRGARFLAMSGLAAAIGARWPGPVRRHIVAISVLWGIVFGATLWRTVAYWERQTSRQ